MERDDLNELKAAIKESPENIPLRKFLIKALIQQQRYEEAEIELKDAIRMASEDWDLKTNLAHVFYLLKKTTLGLVLIEEIIQQQKPPARAWIVHAQLLLANKQPLAAKEAYEYAIAIDPNLQDNFLASEINQRVRSKQELQDADNRIRIGTVEEDSEQSIHIERPKITFDDVGGMDTIKEEIRKKIIHPIQHPEIYKAYGKKIGGGILIYGPPGCGKTHLARATAGQINSNFIAVGINDVLDMWMGQSERNLHGIFQKARNLKPCVLFFDEVDALGANRSIMKHSAGRNLINQFLAEMDGIEYDNEGVLILAATNAPWHLDPAFRRPGRFDRILFVPPPDTDARKAILEIKLKQKPIHRLDYSKIVKKTKGFSGADLEAIIDLAIEAKLDESIASGKALPIEQSDLERAIKRHRPTTKEWFGTAKNYALFANETGIYDDILNYINTNS